MAWGKKKEESKGKKPVKVVNISDQVNAKDKKATMWCTMHSCSKLACPSGNHD
jgi:hypothetical protein